MRLPHLLPRAQNGVCRAPGFFTSGWDFKALGEPLQGLKSIVHLDSVGELGGNVLPERLFEVRANDENNLSKTGAKGVEDRVIQDRLSMRTHRIDLFEAAVTAAHSGRHDK